MPHTQALLRRRKQAMATLSKLHNLRTANSNLATVNQRMDKTQVHPDNNQHTVNLSMAIKAISQQHNKEDTSRLEE